MKAKVFLDREIRKLNYQCAAMCHHRLCEVRRLVNDDASINQAQISELQKMLEKKGRSQKDVLAIATFINTCHE